MRRNIQGTCPYPESLLQCVRNIIDRVVRFEGDMKVLMRVLYICKTSEDLERYQDFSLAASEFVRDKLKPVLLDAYRSYNPDAVRGAFFEEIMYQRSRMLHCDQFEISRWPLYGSISPVCSECRNKSVDIFESGDHCEVALECKVNLHLWIKKHAQEGNHLACLESLRRNHSRQSLRVYFATLDPPQREKKVNDQFAAASFKPDKILFNAGLASW